MSNNNLDKWDVLLSISSGAITASMDILWSEDIDFQEAHKWGKDKTENFIKKIAKKQNLAGSVRSLERNNDMIGDRLINKFGGGNHHHLRDFSHHPTPVGLIFSILMQFTGYGYGTDTQGNFITHQIKDWKKPDLANGIYQGTVVWFFHILSDIAGSSRTIAAGGEGTGLPGPLLSMLKETSSIPLIKNIAGKAKNKKGELTDNYAFSVMCSKLFNGTLLGEHDENGDIIHNKELKFDFRTELGLVNEILTKQSLPVVFNGVIVSAFYSIRRFLNELEEKSIESIEQLNTIDIKKCLPFNNETLTHMRMISSFTFSSIDITSAGIKAAAKHKENKTDFAIDFLKSINYCGIFSLTLSTNSKVISAVQKLHKEFTEIAEKQKSKFIAMLPDGKLDYEVGKYAVETAVSITKIGTPVGFISATIGVFDQIRTAYSELEIAKEERIRIEKECNERIAILEENKLEMEQIVSDYLYNKMTVFADAFDTMDRAITENDIDSFIAGNNMIQNELGKSAQYNNMQEFDELMLSDTDITF